MNEHSFSSKGSQVQGYPAPAMNLMGVRNPAVDGPQGDAIPFFHEGRYHLYYLEAPAGELDQPERGRTPWRHIVSDDLLHWQNLGIVLPLGEGDDPDIDGIWTGSIIAVDGVLHVFYTGGRRSAEIPQTVCHARSFDGINFTKTPSNPILLPQTDWFEPRDWRDPFVFWNEEQQEYWMLISARTRQGPPGRRGVIALATSQNLLDWTTQQTPFYAPGNTYCMECPEVFRLGGKWRMVFSRFSEHAATIYREAAALTGPWRTPAHPALDGARWYAAKSLEDARRRRIAFGWVHDRRGFTEDGEWLWGGDMCLPREIYVGDDDRLCVRPPSEVDTWLSKVEELELLPTFGKWNGGAGGHEARAVGSCAAADIVLGGPPAGPLQRLTVEAILQDARGAVGLTLYSDADMSSGLAISFDTSNGRVTLGNTVAGREVDRLPEPLVTNWLPPRSDGKIRFDIYLRGNIIEAFVDRKVALTHRCYFDAPLTAGVFIEDGIVRVRAILATHNDPRPKAA